MTLLGIAMTFMSLYNETATVDASLAMHDAIRFLSFSSIAVACFVAQIFILNNIKQKGISISTGGVMIMFFDGAISFIACVLLLMMGLLHQSTKDLVPSFITNESEYFPNFKRDTALLVLAGKK